MLRHRDQLIGRDGDIGAVELQIEEIIGWVVGRAKPGISEDDNIALTAEVLIEKDLTHIRGRLQSVAADA
jgi:hypothetical protein